MPSKILSSASAAGKGRGRNIDGLNFDRSVMCQRQEVHLPGRAAFLIRGEARRWCGGSSEIA
jgi:hypothetical protein